MEINDGGGHLLSFPFFFFFFLKKIYILSSIFFIKLLFEDISVFKQNNLKIAYRSI
jgi:hypothetical protein